MAEKSSQKQARCALLLGAPGTGKTRYLVDAAADFVESGADPEGLLILTPSRVSATRFREDLSARTTRTVSAAPVRAWSAYAFDVLRRGYTEKLLEHLDFQPKLLSGPEQDVMLKELLAGHASGEGAVIFWPEDLQEAVGTHGFRHEVRDLFDRLAEYDVTAQGLEELAQQMNQPAWAAAAQLYREYQQVRALRMPHAFDPSGLIRSASRLLKKHPDFLAAERQRLKLILVDDFQEATPSIYEFLGILAGEPGDALSGLPAPDLLVAACPDTTVQGFRGARPDALKNLPRLLPHLEKVSLRQSFRMAPVLAEAWAAVASRLPSIPGVPLERHLEAAPHQEQDGEQALLPLGDDGTMLDPTKVKENQPSIEAHTVISASAEAALIAQKILEDHLYQGRAYGRSAVIVRNSSDVARIRRGLQALGVPTKVAASLTPVRDEPAARPFLDALALLLHAQNMEAEKEEAAEAPLEGAGRRAQVRWGMGADTALALLSSRLGGASAMEIRRLRQSLRAQELRSGGTRHSDDLLVEALMQPEAIPERGGGFALHRVARVLKAGAEALKVPGANAETVLWALWEASGLEKTWKAASQGSGPAAERANRDLDAMIGLFEAASRYVDQMPGATAAQFYDYIDAQDLPMDTLAARASQADAVEIMTAALASGREWDTVYVPGIQDGSWPNTTLRGSLLNTQLLIDTLEVGPEDARRVTLTQRAKQNRWDEIRLFSTAISRARKHLVLTAVSTLEEAPSELLDIACPHISEDGSPRPLTQVRRPMTLRSLVAELRQFSEREDEDPFRADASASLLHHLKNWGSEAQVDIPGVHPASWWGLLPLSSTAPAFTEDQPVPVSPSRIETIHSSPLDWFVAAARAEAATDLARSIGTLVHAIAEDMPRAAGHELEAELELRFAQLHLPDTWETQELYKKAKRMLRRLASYIADLPGKGRELVGVEGAFSVLITEGARPALLSGRVDRLELDQLGRFVVIDLKTGQNKPSKAQIQEHAQLASYQVALEAGAGQQMQEMIQAREEGTYYRQEPVTFTRLTGSSGGAYLLQLGDTKKDYDDQAQEPLSPESTWAVDLITGAAQLIAESYIQARHSSGGTFTSSCKLPEICPLCARGRQVTQGE